MGGHGRGGGLRAGVGEGAGGRDLRTGGGEEGMREVKSGCSLCRLPLELGINLSNGYASISAAAALL